MDKCTINEFWHSVDSGGQYASGTVTVAPVVKMIKESKDVFAVFINLGVDLSLTPQDLKELLEQLYRDDSTKIRTRVQTQHERCFPELEGEGKGSKPSPELQRLWNKNGLATKKKLDTLNRPILGKEMGFRILERWETNLSNLWNCLEEIIDDAIFCKSPPPPRCRVSAMVDKCVVRETSLTIERTNTSPRAIWDDATFTGGKGYKQCNYFPKNQVRRIHRWITSTNASMVIMEMAMEKWALTLGAYNGQSHYLQLMRQMEEIRCTQLKILASSLVGYRATKKCLQSIRVRGWKWVPKDSSNQQNPNEA